MKKFRVTGNVSIEVKTFIEAETLEEAEELAADREVCICIHGTEDSDADDDWVYVDCPDMVTIDYAEEE